MSSKTIKMKKIKFEYKVAMIYLIATLLWMSCCDLFFKKIINDLSTLYEIKRFKDILFALATTTLLYIFLRNHLGKLREAEAKATESDRFKNAFLQNISNDIIYPMNAIFNASKQLSIRLQKTNHSIDSLDIITKNTTKLSNIVNEIVDLSLLQSGDIQPNYTKVQLNRVIDEIDQKIRPQIEKGIYFSHLKGDKNEELLIETDGIKVKQILMRLINNSIKFTQKGEIQFGYAIKNDNLIFFVKDTGVGIKQDIKEKIFNVFHQEQISQLGLPNGIGLGLTLCQGYVHVLSGKIWVESEPGIGSTFYFTIPYKPIKSEEKKIVADKEKEMIKNTIN